MNFFIYIFITLTLFGCGSGSSGGGGGGGKISLRAKEEPVENEVDPTAYGVVGGNFMYIDDKTRFVSETGDFKVASQSNSFFKRLILLQTKEGGDWKTDEAIKIDECSDENPSDIREKKYNIKFIPRAITMNKDENKMLLAMQVRHEKTENSPFKQGKSCLYLFQKMQNNKWAVKKKIDDNTEAIKIENHKLLSGFFIQNNIVLELIPEDIDTEENQQKKPKDKSAIAITMGVEDNNVVSRPDNEQKELEGLGSDLWDDKVYFQKSSFKRHGSQLDAIYIKDTEITLKDELDIIVSVHKFIPKEIGKIINDNFKPGVEEMIAEDFKHIHNDEGKHKRIIAGKCKIGNSLKNCYCIQNILNISYEQQGLESCEIKEGNPENSQLKIVLNSDGTDFIIIDLTTDDEGKNQLKIEKLEIPADLEFDKSYKGKICLDTKTESLTADYLIESTEETISSLPDKNIGMIELRGNLMTLSTVKNSVKTIDQSNNENTKLEELRIK